VVDSSPSESANRTVRDFAYCSRGDDRGLFGSQVSLLRVAGESASDSDFVHGRWIGLFKVGRQGLTRLKTVLNVLRSRADFHTLDLPALLNALIADGAAIEVTYIHGHWRGVNDLEELRRAADFAPAHSSRDAADD
jgi:phosphoenolpyruvate phosphomutase